MKTAKEFYPHGEVWYMENNKPVQGFIFLKSIMAAICSKGNQHAIVSYTVNDGRGGPSSSVCVDNLFHSKDELIQGLLEAS